MSEKAFSERYASETLTDNKALDHFRQCKDCFFRVGGTMDGGTLDNYRRGSCTMFPYPESKPHGVYTGSDECEHYVKE